jgi:hypothetical protein
MHFSRGQSQYPCGLDASTESAALCRFLLCFFPDHEQRQRVEQPPLPPLPWTWSILTLAVLLWVVFLPILVILSLRHQATEAVAVVSTTTVAFVEAVVAGVVVGTTSDLLNMLFLLLHQLWMAQLVFLCMRHILLLSPVSLCQS